VFLEDKEVRKGVLKGKKSEKREKERRGEEKRKKKKKTEYSPNLLSMICVCTLVGNTLPV
jgi:hypothetical protein